MALRGVFQLVRLPAKTFRNRHTMPGRRPRRRLRWLAWLQPRRRVETGAQQCLEATRAYVGAAATGQAKGMSHEEAQEAGEDAVKDALKDAGVPKEQVDAMEQHAIQEGKVIVFGEEPGPRIKRPAPTAEAEPRLRTIHRGRGCCQPGVRCRPDQAGAVREGVSGGLPHCEGGALGFVWDDARPMASWARSWWLLQPTWL